MTAITEPLLESVIALCRDAGRAILAVYNGDFDVDYKSDDSPVTEADRAADSLLRAGLAALLPVPVLSEESAIPPFEERRQWRRYWLVDPLDGTKEFINRNGEFTVNVALVEAGTPVLGVVYAPSLRQLYSGVRGVGAEKRVYAEDDGLVSRKIIHTRALAGLRQAGRPVVVATSRRHGTEAVAQWMERLTAQWGSAETVDMGSSLKFCIIAEGLADVYPRLSPTSEWDTAAAQAVLEAAGGGVLTQGLTSLQYNQKARLLNPFFYAIGDAGVDWRRLLVE